MKHIVLACLLLISLATPARAQTPPLLVFVSPGRVQLEHGQTFTLTLSIYSTATEPVTPTLTLLPAMGLVLADQPQWSAGHVWQDHPATVLVTYFVTEQAPGGGAYLPIDVIVGDSLSNKTFASTSVRVGFYQWPDAQSGRRVYLPLVGSG